MASGRLPLPERGQPVSSARAAVEDPADRDQWQVASVPTPDN